MTDSILSKTRRTAVLVWALRILLAVVFLSEGIDKFSERRLWVRLFDQIGFGQWFRYFTGVVEVVGALLLLIPRATLVGVGLLICTMIGAVVVHLFVTGVGPQTFGVAILMALLSILGRATITRRWT